MDISLSMGNSQLAASWLVPGCLKTPSRWDTTTKYHWKYTLKSNILIYDYFFAYTASMERNLATFFKGYFKQVSLGNFFSDDFQDFFSIL